MVDRRYIDFRQPRGVADTVNATFYLLRNEFAPLLKALVYMAGPLILLSSFLLALEHEYWFEGLGSDQWIAAAPHSRLVYGGFVVAGLITSYLIVVIGFVYGMEYVETGRGRIEPGAVWRRMRSDAGVLISTILWSSLLYIVLGLVLIVPILGVFVFLAIGLYLAPIVMLVFPARMDTRHGFWRAYKRVRDELMISWPRAFGVLLVTGVAVSAAGFGVTIASELLYFGVVDLVGPALAPVAIFVTTLFNVAWNVLLVIPPIAFVIYYMGLVEEAEGVGLAARVEAMAAEDPLHQTSDTPSH